MSDSVRIDPIEVHDAAPVFAVGEQSVSGALEQARSALAGLGDFCGHDSQGEQFAAAYSPAATQLLQAVANIAQGLGSITPGLEAMADNHARVDAHYAARMGAAHPGMSR